MNKNKDSIVIGFALFAMFFGAGNLIFPPYLGMTSGSQWFIGFLAFVLADVGLAILTIVAMVNGDGTITGITGKIGKIPSLILNTAVIVCIGPLLAIPRTAATTFEMAVLPILPSANSWIFSILFFAIALALTIRPSKVVDIIGKFLTPLMFIALLALILQGIISPLGPISDSIMTESVIKDGVIAGYQSMDVLGALAFVIIIISTVVQKGYTDAKDRIKIVLSASIIAGIGLFIIYGGLSYLGATVSTIYDTTVNQASLLVLITKGLLGDFGVWILALITALACLTTAIGLASASATYFENLSNGKVKYSTIVIIISVFSLLVSNFGISVIIGFATPILNVVYPVIMVLIALSFFKNKIKNNHVFKGATLGALITSILVIIIPVTNVEILISLIEALPFAEFGFHWVTPSIIGGLIGALIKQKSLAVDVV